LGVRTYHLGEYAPNLSKIGVSRPKRRNIKIAVSAKLFIESRPNLKTKL